MVMCGLGFPVAHLGGRGWSLSVIPPSTRVLGSGLCRQPNTPDGTSTKCCRGLDAQEVVNDLIARANGQIPVLVCFEPPPPDPQWCHRGLVSAWLHDELGLRIPEVGHEDLGFGWAHPKLDPCLFR
jgi:hypothetical protein